MALAAQAQVSATDPGVVARAARAEPITFGITPVFLVDQVAFLNGWKHWLSAQLGQPVKFVRRKSYTEITDLLLAGELDAAWLCSFSFVFNQPSLPPLAVPLFRGEPYYESYLIVPAEDQTTRGYQDLEDRVFAYVEPRSNTGYLYPRYRLQQLGKDPNHWFRETFFTWSHTESVEAVAEHFADAAAVDSYIWESLDLSQPELTTKTRVVSGSQRFGFPPIVAGTFLSEETAQRIARVLQQMHQDAEGRRLLTMLNLDRFIAVDPAIYEPIPIMIQSVLPLSE